MVTKARGKRKTRPTGGMEGKRLRDVIFAEAYLRTRSPAEAYRAAFNRPGIDDTTAMRRGCMHMKNSEYIREVLQVALGGAMKQLNVTAERILQEIAAVAFLDPAEMFDANGLPLPIYKMPEHVRRAIASLDVKTEFGDDDVIIRKIKAEPKLKALELLGKTFAMWVDRLQVDESSSKAPSASEVDIKDRIAMMLGKPLTKEVQAKIDDVEPKALTDASGVWE